MDLTEGQWLWLMIHMAIDNDEKLEKTCNKCQSSLEQERCIACGDKMAIMDFNPLFDEEMFEKLKRESTI